jgi:uncharacterized protein YgiM (DUF1202 family)
VRIFSLIVLLIASAPSLAQTAAVIDGTRVNLRSGRADTYRVIKSLEPGTQVEIMHDENGYVHVKTAAGDVGWVPERMLKYAASNANASEPDPRLASLQAELDQARAQLAQSPRQPAGFTPWTLAGVGLGSLLFGALLGMGGLQAYYQRRLKGLRI